ncbi:hypothetical protein Tco_0244009, partial [Tanacetum coccineum]
MMIQKYLLLNEDIYQNSIDGIFTTSSYDDEGAVADFRNLETVVNVSPIPTLRIHSTHPKALILGDPNSAVQTRSKVNKNMTEFRESLRGVTDGTEALLIPTLLILWLDKVITDRPKVSTDGSKVSTDNPLFD